MQRTASRRLLLAALCVTLTCTMIAPAYAFWGKRETAVPTLSELTRSVVFGDTLTFRAEDFAASDGDKLTQLTIAALPDPNSGILTMGDQAVEPGTVIHAQAVNGLRFQPVSATTATTASFTVIPTFSSGTQGTGVAVNIHLLSAPNQSPIAENLSLRTYKNVAITGRLQASDADGDPLTFQLTSSPARGSVTISEDGSGSFVYTPYEDKSGKDSFTYVAVDRAGNISNPAKVSLRIEKAATSITYADMAGHPAHHAAIRLAEEDLLVGAQVNGLYFFAPDTPVSRSQFLALAMSVSGLDPLKQVSLTGFADDSAIPTWSKGYVSSALMAGAISGTHNELGQAVFCAERPITCGEAAAILDKLLAVSDVAVESWAAAGVPQSAQGHWAAQPAADLACAGILSLSDNAEPLDAPLSRADAAQLLSNSLDLLKNRDGKWF